jgi:hypothetical protein
MTKFNFYSDDWNAPLPAGHNKAGETIHPDRSRSYSPPFFHIPCECGGLWQVVNRSSDLRRTIQFIHFEAENKR